MKILLAGLVGADPKLLFEDERLENVRQLMAGGCYGTLVDEAGDQGTPGGGESAHYVQAVQAGLLGVEHRLVPLGGPQQGSGAMHIDRYQDIDRALGDVFEQVDEETAVVLISGPAAASGQDEPGPSQGCFILAAPGSPLSGELQGVRPVDIAPTLLQLAGVALPTALGGRSLLEGRELSEAPDDLSAEEEELLRERLSALGYIG
jgi:hypothetical protein